MARILCGVMGDALGHMIQARVLAQVLAEHEFLFLGGGQASQLTGLGHCVESLPVPGTVYANNRLDLPATIVSGLTALARLRPALARVRAIIRQFQPQLILSLYEFFTPLAARQLGLECLSLDQQHLLTHCQPLPIPGQTSGRRLLQASLRGLFGWSSHHWLHSFFPLVPRDPVRTEVFSPLLSPSLRSLRPVSGESVLVYQTSSTFGGLLPALEQWGRPCLIYGLGRRPARKRLVFRPPDPEAFLADLAACRFLVANGGHNAISEALFLGKPVLSLPIAQAYEQYVNAFMLRRMGYGDFSLNSHPSPELFRSFEARLGQFQRAIAGQDFYGTDRLCARLRQRLQQCHSPASRPEDMTTSHG